MKTFSKLLVVCLVMTVITAGLTPQSARAAKNTVTYAMYGDVKDWDPAIAFSLEIQMLLNVYEPLVWYNKPGSDKQLSPGLATEWKVSDDGLTWSFKIREGVKFHDGEPLTAEAAKMSLERTKTEKKGPWYIWADVESFAATDEHTLVIKTKSPQPIDLIAAAQYGAYIYSPKAAEMGTDWFNQGNAAGTGPYKVRQWEQGQQVVLEKYEDYWGGWNEEQFDRAILKVVTENATQVQMLKAGEADFISLAPADLMESLNAEANIDAYGAPAWKNAMFLINTQKGATANKKFRQALTYLWDYDSVVKDIYAGFAEVGRGPIPATMWGHNASLPAPEFNPEKAKQLLAESGVPENEWKISLAYIGTSEGYKNSALLFQANAAQAGIEVELLPGEWGVIWDKAKNLETAPNIQSMTWWPTYATPNDWLIGLFRTEENAVFNLSHYKNPAFDTLIDEGVAVEGSDRDTAIAKYAEAQQLLIDDAVAIFYADIKTRRANLADIEGVRNNPAYDGVYFYGLNRK